jgi:hypothetical protein
MCNRWYGQGEAFVLPDRGRGLILRGMSSSPSTTEVKLQRRERFRAYMQTFNPTAPPQDAIEAGLVCEELHGSLFRKLAGRADLERGSQQLLVGGVGSGKTTELILAARSLEQEGHVLPLYIDISAETDLSSLNSGALLATFGLHLTRRLWADFPPLRQGMEALLGPGKPYGRLKEYAYGKQEAGVTTDEALGQRYPAAAEADRVHQADAYIAIRSVLGKLNPPALPALSRDIEEIRGPLEEFLAVARDAQKEVVAVFDGLDRLLDPTRFWSVASQDLRLFRELKVSVVLTAPLSVLFGARVGQSVSDHFDKVYHVPVVAVDPVRGLLGSVLEKRHGYELLSDVDADSVCEYSGGVLRDLVSLARDAAVEAYISGHDSVTSEDVENVVQQLGTGYLRGLGPYEMNLLLRLEESKWFDVSRATSVELLLTRRVLEYSSTDFRVHPALLSVMHVPEPKSA